MRHARGSQTGLTLLEMLLALAVSSMIGLASFVLLDGVTRAEAGAAGTLDLLAQRDRTFRLLTLDVASAAIAEIRNGSELVLTIGDGQRIWRVSDRGVERSVNEEDQRALRQRLSGEPAAFEFRNGGLLALHLSRSNHWKLIALPAPRPR